MKNLLKILGIIALVAVIGFSVAACSDDEGDDNNNNNNNNNGDGGLKWPTDLTPTPKTSTDIFTGEEKKWNEGKWAVMPQGLKDATIFFYHSGSDAGVTIGNTTNSYSDPDYFYLSKVEGKKLTVKVQSFTTYDGGFLNEFYGEDGDGSLSSAAKNDEFVLCDDYDITDGVLTLSGGSFPLYFEGKEYKIYN